MPHLLDTNALITLIDLDHPYSQRTQRWLTSVRDQGWYICPIVENGAIRIMSQPAYSQRRLTPAEVATTIEGLKVVSGYSFVANDVSLTDDSLFDLGRLNTSAQITDTYLLGLAAQHGAALATHDRRLVTSAVRHPAARVVLIS